MHAVVLHEFGPASNLMPGEHPDPADESGWATVRLRASALNWHDVLVRRGLYSSPLPHILGADGAGTRTDTGEDVVILPSLWWGNREAAPGPHFEILGDHRSGTYAELVRVPVECLAPRPRELGWAEAAALTLVGVTTYRALVSRGRLREREWLLVLGAGGGVATSAVAMAAGLGAFVVVTSSCEENIESARGLGAVGGVPYADPEWPAQARQLTPNGRGFDLVLDAVGTWRDSVRTLRTGGRLVVIGASRAEQQLLDVRDFYFGQYELVGTTMGSPRDFQGLLSMLDRGILPAPVVDRTYRLDEVAAAHDRLESGKGFGKVVLLHD